MVIPDPSTVLLVIIPAIFDRLEINIPSQLTVSLELAKPALLKIAD